MGRVDRNRVTSCLVVCATICMNSSGCRNQQGQYANPFWSQDRVPPPSTRLVTPGTAQPYYPGDPLPPMQSSTEPQAPTNSTPKNVVASGPTNEPAVQIPTDGESGRFASPIASVSPTNEVAQASFTTPAVDPKEVSVPVSTDFVEQASLWRTPDVARPEVAVTAPTSPVAPMSVATQPMQQAVAPWQPVTQQPMALQPVAPQYSPAPNSMVPMQPVPQAPMVMAPTVPRLRFPGYAAPAGPVAMAPMPYAGPNVVPMPSSPPVYANGTLQTIMVTPLPPNSYPAGPEPEPTLAIDPSAQTTFETPSTASADGFRPRGSQR